MLITVIFLTLLNLQDLKRTLILLNIRKNGVPFSKMHLLFQSGFKATNRIRDSENLSEMQKTAEESMKSYLRKVIS